MPRLTSLLSSLRSRLHGCSSMGSLGGLALSVLVLASGCGDDGGTGYFAPPGGAAGGVGAPGSGGVSETGGDTGTGGIAETGGETGSGGSVGSGGSDPGTGGAALGSGGSDPGMGGSDPGLGGSDPGSGGSDPGVGGAQQTGGTGGGQDGVIIDGMCRPLCASAASDPDGDGWGWENQESCVVPGSTVAQGAEPCTVGGGTGGAGTGGEGTGGAGTGGEGTGGDGTGGDGTGGAPPTNGLPWLHVQGNQIQDPAGNQVTLRGVSTIDLGTTEEWEGGATEMIDRLTDTTDIQGSSPGWYPTVFRLAIYPTDSPDHDSPFTFESGSDAFYEQLLRPVVDYCAQKGVYAIIDWHYIDDTNAHRTTTAEFWSYMAPRFAGDSNVLFELFNEPINYGDWSSVRSDMQSWFDTVRTSASDNLVLVGTPNWCQNVGPTATNPINGTNVAYTAHMYPMHWSDPSLRDEITTAAAVHPVFVTEWGFEQGAHEIVDGTISSYGSPFRQFIDGLGVSWTAWCASSSWFPSMFDSNYNLLVGEGYMGGFTKDWLYDMRNVGVPVSP